MASGERSDLASPATILDADAQAVADAVEPLLFPEPLHRQGVERTRALGAALPAPPLPPMASVEEWTLDCAHGPVPARVFRPDLAADVPALVWLHGGAFCLGDAELGIAPVLELAREVGCVVVSVDYRLAPEHRFPAAFEDAFGALGWLTEHGAARGLDASRLAIGGESAGAGIAASVAVHARDRAMQQPALQVLVTPGTAEAPAPVAAPLTRMLHAEDLAWAQDLYLGPDGDRSDPRAFAAAASSLRGVAPAVVVTADQDPLVDDGRSYAARLVSDDVPVTYVPCTGVFHGFFGMGDAIAKARHARRAISAALRVAFHPDDPQTGGMR